MNPNQALWEKGDFTRIARSMRDSGTRLVERLGIAPGMTVLDLGCGDGTTAIPAARLGATVLGVDIARNLVEAGTARAREHGLTNITFQHGDACDLSGLADASFDRVVSVFGAMFAPKPFDVAREMVRVCRPGGRIVMGNWIPNDPTLVAQILKISAAYTPPPPEGFISPMLWGIEPHVVERFGAAGVPEDHITFARDTFTFHFPGTPSEFVATFRDYYGPTMNAFAAAENAGRAADLTTELEALFTHENTSPEPALLGMVAFAENHGRAIGGIRSAFPAALSVLGSEHDPAAGLEGFDSAKSAAPAHGTPGGGTGKRAGPRDSVGSATH